MKLTVLVALFGVTSLTEVHAAVDTARFLATAKSSPTVSLRAKARADYAKPGFLNPIDRLQFIAEHEPLRDEQEYGFKVSPRGLSEYRLESRLRQQQGNLEDLAYQLELSKALEDRYLALIDHAVLSQKLVALRDVVRRGEREISVLTTASRSAQSDASDLLKARSGHQASRARLAEVESLHGVSLSRLKAMDPTQTKFNLKLDDLLAPASAAERLNQPDVTSADSTSTLRYARETVETSRNEYEYSMARSGKLLDSFSVKMTPEKKGDHRYVFEVAINIPGFEADDYGNRERARQLVRREIEAKEIESAQTSIVGNLKTAFQRSLAALKASQSGADDSSRRLNDRLKRLAQREDPLLLLLMEKEEFESDLRTMDFAADTLRHYVKILSVTGVLAANHGIDFISRAGKSK